MAVLVALVGAYGVHLLYTRCARLDGVGPGPRRHRRRRPGADRLSRLGLDQVPPLELAAVCGTIALVGAGIGAALFGGVVAPFVTALLAIGAPVGAYRRRRLDQRREAQDAWPRVITEIRLLTGSAGRSIPQAVFDAGGAGPAAMREAFADGHHEWLRTTDLARLAVVKDRLADPTTDVRDLLVAHEVGGTDLDRTLRELAEDRLEDSQARKDATAKLAGVRFARRFTLLVPLGMAAAGMAVGNGRAAYATTQGQLLVVVGLALTVACWVWAGQTMRLPAPRRVFAGPDGDA